MSHLSNRHDQNEQSRGDARSCHRNSALGGEARPDGNKPFEFQAQGNPGQLQQIDGTEHRSMGIGPANLHSAKHIDQQINGAPAASPSAGVNANPKFTSSVPRAQHLPQKSPLQSSSKQQ